MGGAARDGQTSLRPPPTACARLEGFREDLTETAHCLWHSGDPRLGSGYENSRPSGFAMTESSMKLPGHMPGLPGMLADISQIQPEPDDQPGRN